MKLFEVAHYQPDLSYKFTEQDIQEIFKPFLDRLEHDHGNNREGMFTHHLSRLVGKTYQQILKAMPEELKGVGKDLTSDIQAALKRRACDPPLNQKVD